METDKNGYPVLRPKETNLKGKISKIGNLFIQRVGQLKAQGCPIAEGNNCGDWCPLFGEPKVSKWMGSPDPEAKDRKLNPKDWTLQICRRTLYFDELIDERTVPQA